MGNGTSEVGKRALVWPDLLKVLAVYAVVLIHTAAPYLTGYEGKGPYYWWAGNLYDSIARWCIPVFVMLSGHFLIDKCSEESFGGFFRRRFVRVFVPFLIWSLIYFVWRIYANGEALSFYAFVPMLFMEPVYYHLWYLYLLLGLYLFAPLMSLYIKNSCCGHAWYYLALWFLAASVLSFIESWFDVTTYVSAGTGNSLFKFAGYFALGWMLKGVELSAAQKALFVVVLATGLAITASGTYHATVVENNGVFNGIFYEYYSFNVFMTAVSVFLLGKSVRVGARPGPGRRFLRVFAACVPGIYLVHAILIAVARRGMLGVEITPEFMDPFLGIPVFAFVIFLASFLLVLLIRGLPVIRYIVPAALIIAALSATWVRASDEPEARLIKRDELKTLTRFSRTPLKKLPEPKAWQEAVPQVSTAYIRSTYDGSNQPALFYDSGSDAKKPLLVVLHSWSEDYRQVFGIPYALWAVENDWVFIQPDYGGAFTNQRATASEGAVRDILDALEYAKNNAAVDASRVYLAGFSGGGMAALIMAGRYPELWAGVVSWGAVYDLSEWYSHTKNARHHYSKDIIASCGGRPVKGTAAEAECRRRSPSAYLENARGRVPVYIAAGLDDAFVPPSHSLKAFNDLAESKDRLTQEEMALISKRHRPPPGLASSLDDALFADAAVELLYGRDSGRAALRIYKGSHDVVYNAGLAWLARQRK